MYYLWVTMLIIECIVAWKWSRSAVSFIISQQLSEGDWFFKKKTQFVRAWSVSACLGCCTVLGIMTAVMCHDVELSVSSTVDWETPSPPKNTSLNEMDQNARRTCCPYTVLPPLCSSKLQKISLYKGNVSVMQPFALKKLDYSKHEGIECTFLLENV